MEAPEKGNRRRRRGAFEVLGKTAEDIASWFLPFVIVDGIAQGTRTLFMEPTDLRGPWECLWHKVGIYHGILFLYLILHVPPGFRRDREQ